MKIKCLSNGTMANSTSEVCILTRRIIYIWGLFSVKGGLDHGWLNIRALNSTLTFSCLIAFELEMAINFPKKSPKRRLHSLTPRPFFLFLCPEDLLVSLLPHSTSDFDHPSSYNTNTLYINQTKQMHPHICGSHGLSAANQSRF